MDSDLPNRRAPWGVSYFFLMLFLSGFIGCSIIAAINWRRMGKSNLVWPTIVLSLVIFALVIIISYYAANPLLSIILSLAVNIAVVFSLWQWQKNEYYTWMESHPDAEAPGRLIPTVIILASIALYVLGLIFGY